jgi:hypothetical protein
LRNGVCVKKSKHLFKDEMLLVFDEDRFSPLSFSHSALKHAFEVFASRGKNDPITVDRLILYYENHIIEFLII